MKKTTITTIAIMLLSIPFMVHAADRLVIKDGVGNTTFVVEDTGAATLDSFNGTGKILVAENAIPSNPKRGQTMFELSRAGAVRFDLVDEWTGTTWLLQNRLAAFDITLEGTGVQEFKLESSGNLIIKGTLSENSDVNSKENITLIEGKEMLARLAELPITKWNYKSDASKSSHVGPMAQDFHAAFRLGSDDRHIAPRDLAGVAVVGVKELHKQNLEQTKMIQKRDAEITELRERLAILEELVNRLTLEDDKLAYLSTPNAD